MKLKLIKNDEVVVNKNKYELAQSTVDCQYKLTNAIINEKISYFRDRYGDMVVVKVSDGLSSFPIKVFKSDDSEYNRVCADELVELLRQKQ